jgi:hypothetical protein
MPPRIRSTASPQKAAGFGGPEAGAPVHGTSALRRPYCVTVIGAAVSLVSVNTNAPPFTSKGEVVSDVCCANASTCAVSNDIVFDVAGGVVGGGVVAVVDGSEWSCPPQPAARLAAKHAPIKRILDFMAFSL